MSIFTICFMFEPVGLSIDQEAINMFNFFFLIRKHLAEKERALVEEDYNHIGAIVQVTINE